MLRIGAPDTVGDTIITQPIAWLATYVMNFKAR